MNARWMVLLAALFLMILPITAGNALAQGDTRYGVYVQDEANVISAQTKAALYGRALWLHDKTGTAQVGVVTVSSLNDRTLEDFAVSKFRELGLGDKERNDGVLLLYSASDRHVRIEVGYGLEGRITDGKAGAILDQYFVPNRDAGQLDLAFSQTQSAIVNEVAAEYGLDASGIAEEGMPPLDGNSGGGFFAGMPGYIKVLLGLGVAFLIFLDFKFTGGMITFSIINLLGRRGGSGGGGFRGGGRGGGGSSGGGGASR
ncbi:TPM domain-containing protein [Cohnella luojiensis]|uniref:TPM domain-containing protein n=1 Tax=Cohnella luojiensis TaxID=652876 RepID=UPI0014300555|nr:TPM domain-containing protein [Cohnella luojiensis]